MHIRPAREADLPQILAIYNDAVLHTTAIWNDDLVDFENRRVWFQLRRDQGFPVLVAAENETVLGYASYGDFRAFQGYRLTVENLIYIASEARGKGIGGALLAALIEHAQGAKKHMMVAGITAENEASLRLHRRQGFVETGRMPELGIKFGRFLDLVFLQRRLD